jgi:hypothetical protein
VKKKRIYPWEMPDWAKPQNDSHVVSMIEAVALDALKKAEEEERRRKEAIKVACFYGGHIEVGTSYGTYCSRCGKILGWDRG